ncbi:MAG: type II secretion system protein J [Candidatus Hydrogenedentota bacterium]
MTARRTRGFTLIELMVAISILTVIVSIVYVSFSSVIRASDVARDVAEDMRLRQFLTRNLTTVIPAVYTDAAMQLQSYQFLGEDDQGPYGPADSLTFVVDVPLLGSKSLPGMMKRVTFEVIDKNTEEDGEALTGVAAEAPASKEDEPDLVLEYTEEPLVVAGLGGEGGDDLFASFDAEEQEYASWKVPVRMVDFAYFDGEEWVDDWDTMAEGLLPWSVRVRVNFEKTEGDVDQDRAEGIDPVEDPDFEMTLLLPAGAGATEPFLALNPSAAQYYEGQFFGDD